jgi:hypothetical protein
MDINFGQFCSLRSRFDRNSLICRVFPTFSTQNRRRNTSLSIDIDFEPDWTALPNHFHVFDHLGVDTDHPPRFGWCFRLAVNMVTLQTVMGPDPPLAFSATQIRIS